MPKVTRYLNNRYQKTKENFRSQLNDIRDAILPKQVTQLGDEYFPGSGDKFVFPLSMRTGDYQSRPMISFTIDFERGKSPASVYFPCPGGIAFSDNANYETISLGILGASTPGLLEFGKNAKNMDIIGLDNQRKSAVENLNLSDAIIDSVIGASKAFNLLGVNAAGAASFASQRVSNPRENLSFQNNQARNFSFQFKMIASSEKEAILVRKIQLLFQAAVYANPITGSLNSLRFPPTMEIKFLFRGKENPHIPKIHKVYLTGINSNYNATANTWRSGGEPLEVDCTLNFQEIRVLTREDIKELAKPSPNRDKGERGVFDQIQKSSSEKLSKAKEETSVAKDTLRYLPFQNDLPFE